MQKTLLPNRMRTRMRRTSKDQLLHINVGPRDQRGTVTCLKQQRNVKNMGISDDEYDAIE